MKKSLYSIAAGLIFIILLTFTLRSPVAEWYIRRTVANFNRTHQGKLQIARVRILGLASIRITGISLRPDDGDTLVRIDTAYASIGILKLFAGRLSIHQVELKNAWFTLVNDAGESNYHFLIRTKPAQKDTIRARIDYSVAFNQLLQFVFDKIPLSMTIRDLRISYTDGEHTVALRLDQMQMRDHYFRSNIFIVEDDTLQRMTLSGRIDNHDRLAEFRMFSSGTGRVSVPYIRTRWQAGISFDTLAFRLRQSGSDENDCRLEGFSLVRGLIIDHRMIAAVPLQFEKLAMDFNIHIGSDFLELDSTSAITFNRITINPYVRYRPWPSRQITLRIHKPPFPAQDLFSSFPEGLFSNLDGIRVRGQLSWFLDFFVDLSQPDSLQFSTSLDRHQFGVTAFGNSDLTRMNEPFTYTAYEHDQPVRSFIVGPENPDFRTLAQISGYLPLAVMTSEDGGFYQHRGFLPDAFRESMITNIKERRFARGGSTISMQLVKNVFLNRNKTIARKVEEALIVWLIENQGLCSKERMMEIYLNVIEWGPLIYGANEAARFYFNKDASRITLAEAIFLASIVPRPKWFRSSFDESGNLREFNAAFYTVVSAKMLSKGWITQAEADKLEPKVELRGPARLLLKQSVPLPADSLFQEE